MNYGNNDWKSGCMFALMVIGISFVVASLCCFVCTYFGMELWNTITNNN